MSKPSQSPAGGPPLGRGFGSLPRLDAVQTGRTRAEIPEWDSSFLLKAILGGLLLVILILGAIFAPGIYDRWRIQRDRTAALESFDAALERRDFQAALEALKPFLTHHPEDFRSHDHLAEFLNQPPEWMGTDQIASLDSLLLDGLRFHPDQIDWRRALMTNALRRGDIETALDQAEWIVTTTGVPVEVVVDVIDRLEALGDAPLVQARRLAMLEYAERQNREDPQILIRLVRYNARARRPEAMIRDLKPLVRMRPDDPELIYLTGVVQKLQGREAEAAELFSRARQADPNLIAAWQGELEHLLKYEATRERGWRLLGQFIQAHSSNPAAHLAEAWVCQRLDPERAARALQRAHELDPTSPDLALGWSEALVSDQRFEEALTLLARFSDREVFDPRFALQRARILKRAGRPLEALAVLRTARDRFPEARRLRFDLADLLLELDRREELDVELAQWPNLPALEPLQQFFKGMILARSNRPGEAVAPLTNALNSLKDDSETAVRAGLTLANCLRLLDRFDEQIRVLKDVLDLDPRRSTVRARLADLMGWQGRLDDALLVAAPLGSTFTRARLLLAWLEYARLLETDPKSRSWNGFDTMLIDLREVLPTDPGMRLLSIQGQLARGRPEAASELDEALRRHPDQAAFLALSAALEARAGRGESARNRLAQLARASLDPFDRAWGLIAGWSQVGGSEAVAALKDMVGPVEQLAGDRGDRVRVYLLATLSGLGQDEEVRRILERWSDQFTGNAHLRRFDLAFALEQRDSPRLAQLRDHWRAIEGSGGVWWRLAEAVRLIIEAETPSSPSDQRAESHTARAVDRTPGSRVAAEATGLAQADALLADLTQRQPAWSFVLTLRGRIAARVRRWDQAIEHANQALKIDPDSVAAAELLLGSLAAQGRYAQLDAAPNKLRPQIGQTSLMRILAVEAALARDDLNRLADLLIEGGSEALRRHDSAVPPKAIPIDPSDDIAPLVREGRALERLGLYASAVDRYREAIVRARRTQRPDEALDAWSGWASTLTRYSGRDQDVAKVREAAAKALSPTALAVLDARLHRNAGRLDEASAALERARKTASAAERAEIRLEASEVHLQAGRFDQAEFEVRAVLEANPQDQPATASQLERARRRLADLLALRDRSNPSGTDPQRGAGSEAAAVAEFMTGVDPARLTEALELIATNLGRPGGPLADDLRIQAAILGRFRDGERRRQAIQLIEQAAMFDPGRSEDWLRVAELARINLDWPSARRAYERYLKEDRIDLDRVASLAWEFLERGDTANASTAVRILVQRQPAMGRTRLLQARLAYAEDKRVLAMNLTNVALADDSIPLIDRARLLEQTGRLNEAIQLLEPEKLDDPAAWPDPALRRESARLLSRTGRPERLLDLIDEYLARFDQRVQAPPSNKPLVDPALTRTLADLAAQALDRRIDLDPSQLLRFDRTLNRAISATAQDPQGIAFFNALGLLRDRQERYDEAIECFRRVRAAQPSHRQASNNLAYLLALSRRDLREASQAVNDAIQSGGPLGNLLDTRGLVALAQGRLDQAVNDFQAALNDKNDPVIRFHLAWAYFLSRNLDEAGVRLAQARRDDLLETDLHPLERPIYRKLVEDLP